MLSDVETESTSLQLSVWSITTLFIIFLTLAFLALDLHFLPKTLKNGFRFSEFFSFLKAFR